jgi:hypothetical protein
MSLIAITDELEVETIDRLTAGLVEKPAHLSGAWLLSNRWRVVPVLSGGHFIDSQAEHLSNALRAIQCFNIFGIATEKVNDCAFVFSLQSSKSDLLGFSEKCGFLNAVLVPSDRVLAVLCTVYDYYLVAGAPDFVQSAVGGDIESAWRAFEEEALDPSWDGYLQKIVDRYHPIDFAVSSIPKSN